MGRVWLARDEMLHRDVVVKEVLLPPDLSDAERDELFQRTLREARTAGRLNHPNVVAVHDVVQAQERPWIAMELVRSRSLYQVVKEDGPAAPKRAAEIGLAVRSPFARESSMATLTALATEPLDPLKRAGVLCPVLIGLLRKNPRWRMRAAEAERLLRRIVDGNTKSAGRKSPLFGVGASQVPAPRSGCLCVCPCWTLSGWQSAGACRFDPFGQIAQCAANDGFLGG
jgi:hypothetical protein